jgi:adenine-specific DNA-methyltransferase
MDPVQKFQELLKKLFQFESSDLDFGIYRILNYKRDRIEKFIQEDLKNKVETAFAKHKDERLTNINRRFEEAKEKVVQSLGPGAFTPAGELKEEFKNTPVGRDFLSIKAQRDEAETIDEIKLQIFNDLYNFFSRYYEEGDFVPHYRYSIKGHKYAIPYNGEEVKLYWANSEQYYTKTGLLFRDYTFNAGDYKVIFRIGSAKEELGSNKATKERFFVLDDEEPLTVKDKALIIRFQYRELTEKEAKRYEVEGGSNTSKQEKINQKSYDEILKGIKDVTLKGFLVQTKNEKPLLLYHISRLTAKNTKDYFIHKNLKKFLSEQLDYFIKAEVLSLETLEKERFLDKHITRAKVVREIGEDIIDFLSQIEDFQKRLWEKKKFVLKTEYVITTDRVPEEFYDEIWKNKEQRKEWEELGFEIPEKKEGLKDKKLPIDTKYFSPEFKEELLEKLTNSNNPSPLMGEGKGEGESLDDLLDGLLIKSENWQALNTILEKYKGAIKTIYIDPPYNTGNDEFLYRDRYQHSSWLSMMENRLRLSSDIMQNDAVLFISIGDTLRSQVRINSTSRLQFLCNELFGENNYVANFVRKSGTAPRQDIKHIANSHDYILCYTKDVEIAKINRKPADISRLRYLDEHVNTRGKFDLNQLDRGSIQYSESLDYSIVIGKGKIIEIFDGQSFQKITAPEKIEIWPGGDPNDKRWIFRWSEEKVKWGIENDFIVFKKDRNGKWKVYYKEYELVDNEGRPRERTNPYDTLILEFQNELGTSEIESLFNRRLFEYPKPSDLIKHLLKIGSDSNSLVCDFFAGSGTTAHAVMKLNKEDGGKRKFILVEMADYFDTIIIPRIKKVAYSFNWKDGKPQDTDGIGIFFKYQILEQYEDTLDNIELKENNKAEELFKDDYLLKYFLNFETRESLYLLNIDMLKNPFAYKLKVNLEEVGEPQEVVVDIPETFNYLLGLKVKKVKARNNGRKYLFILGEKQGKDIAIVWREYDDNWTDEDFKKDKEFIIKELNPWAPHIVYVNGQSVLTTKLGERTVDIKYIEPEFKKLMEE